MFFLFSFQNLNNLKKKRNKDYANEVKIECLSFGGWWEIGLVLPIINGTGKKNIWKLLPSHIHSLSPNDTRQFFKIKKKNIFFNSNIYIFCFLVQITRGNDDERRTTMMTMKFFLYWVKCSCVAHRRICFDRN